MKISIFLITVVAVLFLLGGMFFYGLVFPIWMFVDCVTSQTISKKAKILWAIALFVIWPLASFFYGLLASGKRVIQWLSGGGLFGTVALFVGLFFLVGFLSRAASTELIKAEGRLPRVEMSGISEPERAKLPETLQVLREECQKGGLFHLDRKRVSWELAEMFVLFIEDDKLSRSEYDDWASKYESRQVLDLDALEDHVRDLKRAKK